MTRMYIGSRGGLLVADENKPDEVRSHFAGSAVEAIAIDPTDPARVYVAFYSGQEVQGQVDRETAGGLRGVWRSDNAGETWQDVSAGLPVPATLSLAVGRDGTVYAGSEPSALSISRDRGASWEPAGNLMALPSASTWAFPPRPQTHHVRYVEIDPVQSDHLYLCIEAGALIQSLDRGATWQDRTPDGPFDTHTLATHPLAPGRLYAAAGDGFLRPGDGYAESRDRGATWTRFGDGLQHHYLYGLAVDSQNPETVLVSAAATAMAAHSPIEAESYIYRRTGNGAWELAMDGLPTAKGTTIQIIAAHPSEGGRFYAASNLGAFRSDDAGKSWAVVPIPWPPHYRFQNAKAIALTA